MDGRSTWAVGFSDGLVRSGAAVDNRLSTATTTFKPFTRALVFDVVDTIPTTIRRDGGNRVLEWQGTGEGGAYDVYSFTEFDTDSVTLWEKGVPTGEVTTTLSSPIPNDPRRFFNVVPAPLVGGPF